MPQIKLPALCKFPPGILKDWDGFLIFFRFLTSELLKIRGKLAYDLRGKIAYEERTTKS